MQCRRGLAMRILSVRLSVRLSVTRVHCDKMAERSVQIYISAFLIEIGRFAFLRPPLGDLGATYDDHLRLIGKRVLDFLLALIELFSLGITAEALRAIIG